MNEHPESWHITEDEKEKDPQKIEQCRNVYWTLLSTNWKEIGTTYYWRELQETKGCDRCSNFRLPREVYYLFFIS